MLDKRKIEQYCNKVLDKKFHQNELLAMQHQAIVDLKNRNIAGAIIVPIAYLIGGLTTEYSAEHPFLFSFLGFILAIAIGLRVLTIIIFSKTSASYNEDIWLPMFFWSNIFVSAVWSCFAASAALFYHNSLSITLIIILLAGISGGSMASYCIWKLLSFSYLIIILLPTACIEIYIGNSVTVPIGIAISCFLVFNLAQAKHWNDHYWISLVNTFLVKKTAQDMEQLNDQLAQEINDHKNTASKIAVSQRKFRDIYNSAHDAIFIFGLDGNVIDINTTMLTLFGRSRGEVLQFNIAQAFQSHRNQDINLKSIWKKALSGEEQEFIWNAKRDNPPESFTMQANLQRTHWGKDPVIIATVRDITLQIAAKNALLEANRAKSEFLANMSHELRTPMHGIMGYARLGIKRSDQLSKEKINEYFSLIMDSGTRLMTLLTNLLDFSKLEVGKMTYNMQAGDLLPYIHQVTTELTPVATEKELRFTIHCPDNQIPVYCDHEKISQVLRNLLFNAIKFSNKGQEIQINHEKVSNQRGEEKQQISVINFGIPIPEDELEQIFEQFIQSSMTRTGAGGTGLGLAISRQILRDHQSVIWAENHENKSVIFRFTLPLS